MTTAPPTPEKQKASAASRRFPSYLKKAADPREAFASVVEAGKDFAGAASTGYCEDGLTVTVGAGFDFGPLLTFGAPVFQAEVGAELSSTRSDLLLLALVQQPGVVAGKQVSKPISLMQFSGWRLAVQATFYAQVGLSLPESWTGYLAEAGAKVDTGGAVKAIASVSKANPLAAQAEEAEEELAAEEPAADDAETPEEPEEEDDSAGLGVDISATVKAEIGGGYSYLLVRERQPRWYASSQDQGLVELLNLTLNGSTKEQVKERAIELLAGCSVEVKPRNATDDLLENLGRLKPYLEEKRPSAVAACARCIADLEASRLDETSRRTADSAATFLGRMAEEYRRPSLAPASGADAAAVLTKVTEFITFAQAPGPVSLEAGTLATALRAQGAAVVGKTASSGEKETWKQGARKFLMGSNLDGVRPTQTKSKLVGALRGGRSDGLVRTGDGGLDYHTADLNDCLDLVIECRRTQEANRAKNVSEAQRVRTALGAAKTPEIIKTAKAAAKEAGSRFLAMNGTGAQFGASRRVFGHTSSAEIKTKLAQALASGSLVGTAAAEARGLTADLDKISASEKRAVKDRAVQHLASSGRASELPPFPARPSTDALIRLLGTAPAAAELVAALQEVKEAAEDPPLTADELKYAHLCYFSARSPNAAGAATAKAKAKLKVTVGVNEYGGQATASASAEFEIRRANTRLQTPLAYPPGTPPIVQTQDVYVASWSAALKAEARAKRGSTTDRGSPLGVVPASEAGAEREFAMLEWRAGSLRWQHPANPAASPAVTPMPGSGLSFGRSVKRERFLRKTRLIAAGSKPTPYVVRLARSLRVSPATMLEFLVATFGSDDFREETALDPEIEMLMLEASWGLNAGSGLTVELKVPALEDVKRLFKGEPGPSLAYDIPDVRDALKKKFRSAPASFTLQSITARYRVADEVDKGRTLFQVAHEYVVVASLAVSRVRRAGTNGLMEIVTWWPDAAGRTTEAGTDAAKRSRLRDAAVPPTFLLSL